MRKIKRIQHPRNHIQFIVYPEVREEMKPFVFFDAGNMVREDDGLLIGAHPHSGIGIITYFHGADLHHGDSGDNEGVIRAGGVQWIRAGGGVWHQEHYRRPQASGAGPWEASIHQLWLQLPPELEESTVEYRNLQPDDLPVSGNTKVITGEYKGVASRISPPIEMTYLDVSLNRDETWNMETPPGQTIGFLFPRKGALGMGKDLVPNQRMGILEPGEGRIEVAALDGAAKFVIVLASPSSFPVISSRSSIHTNQASLDRSAQRIREIGTRIM